MPYRSTEREAMHAEFLRAADAHRRSEDSSRGLRDARERWRRLQAQIHGLQADVDGNRAEAQRWLRLNPSTSALPHPGKARAAPAGSIASVAGSREQVGQAFRERAALDEEDDSSLLGSHRIAARRIGDGRRARTNADLATYQRPRCNRRAGRARRSGELAARPARTPGQSEAGCGRGAQSCRWRLGRIGGSQGMERDRPAGWQHLQLGSETRSSGADDVGFVGAAPRTSPRSGAVPRRGYLHRVSRYSHGGWRSLSRPVSRQSGHRFAVGYRDPP